MAPASQKKDVKLVTEAPDITILEKIKNDYEASRPLETLLKTKPYNKFTPSQQSQYATFVLLESGAYRHFNGAQRSEFDKIVEKEKIPYPVSKARFESQLQKLKGRDRKNRLLGTLKVHEYREWEEEQRELSRLKEESWLFKRSERETQTKELVEEEIQRRIKIANMEGKTVGNYSKDPAWDDVKPIPQDDGENALAAIAYTQEYAEAISYLRAVMAKDEHSPRILDLTAHIITLNPAHYTVWLYRAATIFALNTSIAEELAWVNKIALENQKNYQIWHHRQLLVDHIYPTLTTESQKADLGASETVFITKMFNLDPKNYHVWSYRQYFVRKLNLFPTACPSELESTSSLIYEDVRNNSAWSHRFFLVFSDPAICTPDCASTAADPAIPQDILDREIEFCKSQVFAAPQNQSPWNYLRGVLRKGDIPLPNLSWFAEQFVNLDGEEEIKSSHALDFLADSWAQEGGQEAADKAAKALDLLAEKYDPIRAKYWEWKKTSIIAQKV